jgi:hypothetical protein
MFRDEPIVTKEGSVYFDKGYTMEVYGYFKNQKDMLRTNLD